MSILSIMLLIGTILGIVAVIMGDLTFMIISSVWLLGSITVGDFFS